MISAKDYAAKKNVSYEAVRKQLTRYKEELQNHITVRNRTRYLDDYAVNFLDQKRAASPIIIVQTTKDEEIDRLKAENAELNRKITAQAEAIAALAQWKAENAMAVAVTENQKLLLEQKDLSIQGLNKQILTYRVEVGELKTAKEAAENHAENLQAFLAGAEERAVQLEGEVSELTEKLQNERSDAARERLELQNQLELLEIQHQRKLEQEQLKCEQQVAVASNEWKKKGILERLFKK